MRKKRRAERKQTRTFFAVYHQKTEKFMGRLIDLSTVGMKLLLENSVADQTAFEFKIELPKPIAGKDHLTFDAECVWCSMSGKSEKKYEAGFKITNIDFEQIEAIQYLLNDPLFEDTEEQPRITLMEKNS